MLFLEVLLTMLWQIEVSTRPGHHDSAGEAAHRRLVDLGISGIAAVRTVRIYLLEGELDEQMAAQAAGELLSDPVTELWSLQPTPPAGFEGKPTLTVRRRPGVMDPAVQSVAKALADLRIPVERVARAVRYHVDAGMGESELAAAGRVLANETIEEILPGADRLTPQPRAPQRPFERREIPLVSVADARLEQISKEACLALTLAEMQAIQAHYAKIGREPTDVELETLAQTWSEHCKHKTLTHPIEFEGRRFENLLKETVMAVTRQLELPWCVSVFVDNAGIIEFVPGWNLCFKVETHNHPSAIEPYGGSGTGVGGVIRDVLGTGLGARPIMTTDVFCLGPPDLPREEVPAGALHPLRVLRGVVSGVRDYGNRMGIPTSNGGLFFDRGYIGNPLVYCGCVGILPADASFKEPRTGDHILVLGGRTGRDGIHGATFSSIELSTDSEMTSSGAVQIGNAIEEKKVVEAVLAARDEGLYTSITDCGAGGLSSAVGEMGEVLGAEVHLERVPLKYDGLTYDEIWISEAQERMVLSVPGEKVSRLQEICQMEGVEATDIGEFTGSGRLVLRYDGQVVADLEMGFLHDGLPQQLRQACWTRPDLPDSDVDLPTSLVDVLLDILAAPNVASKEWVVRQYDHEVQGLSVLKPLVGACGDGPGDAAVIRPVRDVADGVSVGCGMNPEYGRLDPYRMAACAIDEAVRNLVAVGTDPQRIAILDNFSWGNTDHPEELGALVQAALACHDVALAYATPFISGKDSLNNEFLAGEERLVIPPSLLISGIGHVPDVARVVSMDLKEPGNLLYLVGQTSRELGGSHYYRVVGADGGEVPAVDTQRAPRLFAAVHQAMQAGLVRACHDLSEGGLAVALAESAMAGRLGAEVALEAVPVEGVLRDDELLFSESASRFLVEVASDHGEAFEVLFGGLPMGRIGQVTDGEQIRISREGADLVEVSLERIAQAFHTLNRSYG